MKVKGRTTLVCDCEGTMTIDPGRLARALGEAAPERVERQLCRAQVENFERALAGEAPLLVCCTQEAPLFTELAEQQPGKDLRFVNIRERAGWSDEGAAALPKMAALIAEAAIEVAPAREVAFKSEGTCLVYGRDEVALEAAEQLSERLDVTLLLRQPGDLVPPSVMRVPIFTGRVAAAQGHLGAFEIVVDGYAPAEVSSRTSLGFATPRDGASATCDLILDLSGGDALFPAHERRDGYLRVDPRDPVAVQKALFRLSDMVGEFSKPRYVSFDADLCAHSRSRKTGCTRCLDVCPASAIRPDGDVVAIDPYLCGGCGSCNSVCPTGAAAYDYPANRALLERAQALLRTYAEAGGRTPVVLVHDGGEGAACLDMLARLGRGLPAHVLPFAVHEVTQLSLDVLVGLFAYGAAQVILLAPPKRRGELGGLAQQVGIMEAVMDGLGYGSGRLDVLVENDPDALEAALWGRDVPEPAAPGYYLPLGNKRALMRLGLERLRDVAPEPADEIALPPGAPFGRVLVEDAGCTLCLACVGACPTGALLDNPDKPQLSFQESACIQCGLCRNTCPESVISLEPRLSFDKAAQSAVVLKEEEPFACVRCGKAFGTRSSIERILDRLADKHSMFRNPAAIERIKMCEDCRVISQFEEEETPMAASARPMPRTTEDYLREREELAAARARMQAEKDRGGG